MHHFSPSRLLSLLGLVLVACAPASPVAKATAVPAKPAEPSSECRGRAAAEQLVRDGDGLLSTNVVGAVEKYEQAVELDPANHTTFFKLSLAEAKTERWDHSAVSALRAGQLAPGFASYWYQRGLALMKVAAAGDSEAYAEAREPLRKCVQADPHFADCYDLLGQAEEWLDEPQGAASYYGQAIRAEPTRAEFYLRLAELYVVMRHPAEARAVLDEGLRLASTEQAQRAAQARLLLLSARLAHQRGDRTGELDALLNAQSFRDDSIPDLEFQLGAAYASVDPPEKELAIRNLVLFTKRVCRGALAAKYKDSCEQAQSTLQRLGQ